MAQQSTPGWKIPFDNPQNDTFVLLNSDSCVFLSKNTGYKYQSLKRDTLLPSMFSHPRTGQKILIIPVPTDYLKVVVDNYNASQQDLDHIKQQYGPGGQCANYGTPLSVFTWEQYQNLKNRQSQTGQQQPEIEGIEVDHNALHGESSGGGGNAGEEQFILEANDISSSGPASNEQLVTYGGRQYYASISPGSRQRLFYPRINVGARITVSVTRVTNPTLMIQLNNDLAQIRNIVSQTDYGRAPNHCQSGVCVCQFNINQLRRILRATNLTEAYKNQNDITKWHACAMFDYLRHKGVITADDLLPLTLDTYGRLQTVAIDFDPDPYGLLTPYGYGIGVTGGIGGNDVVVVDEDDLDYDLYDYDPYAFDTIFFG